LKSKFDNSVSLVTQYVEQGTFRNQKGKFTTKIFKNKREINYFLGIKL